MGMGNHLQKTIAMPIRKQDYHPEWPAISRQIREEAGQKCEWCEAPNGQVIKRGKGKEWAEIYAARAPDAAEWESVKGMSWARLKFHGLTRVVLTVAHLDRNSKNNDRHNLAALCQGCHLNHDIRQHIANRKYGRYHAKEQQMKLEI